MSEKRSYTPAQFFVRPFMLALGIYAFLGGIEAGTVAYTGEEGHLWGMQAPETPAAEAGTWTAAVLFGALGLVVIYQSIRPWLEKTN